MSTGFRRGFKTFVAECVTELRCELGAKPLDPIDPCEVARHLCVPVIGLSTGPPGLLAEFRNLGTESRFFAATVPVGGQLVIFHNDFLPRRRQKSDIAHELGHIVLEHEFMPLAGSLESRDHRVEREADWFGFSLLVTDEAALSLARSRLPLPECAQLLDVSDEAMSFRLHATGAMKRAERERQRQRRR